MDTASLLYFVRSCELSSFSKAAEELHITQPALSRRILALEDEVGAPLFERFSKGVRMTENGRIFYESANKILNIEQQTIDRISNNRYGSTGRLIVGYYHDDYLEPLIYAVREMSTTYPNVEVIMTDMSHDLAVYNLMHEQADLIYVNKNDIKELKGFATEIILKNAIVALVSKEHPLHNRASIEVSEIADEHFVLPEAAMELGGGKSIRKAFREAGLTFDKAKICASPNARLFYIAAGCGIGISGRFPTENLQEFSEYITKIPINDVKLDIADMMAVYRFNNSNAERFAGFMVEFAEEKNEKADY